MSRDDPDREATCSLGSHLGTRDKSLVELGVKFASARILTTLKSQQFFGIAELNEAIAPLLEQLNDVPFQKKTGTRRSQFEELDRPAMRPLPETPYEFREWKKLKANIDYHVQANYAYYSVPYRLVGKKMDVCIGENLVKCYIKGELVATHLRIKTKGGFTHNIHLTSIGTFFRARQKTMYRSFFAGFNRISLVFRVRIGLAKDSRECLTNSP